jgi:hypothetical protein
MNPDDIPLAAEPSNPSALTWSPALPTSPGWWRWRSALTLAGQCVWVLSVESDHVQAWIIGAGEPFAIRNGEWCGPIEFPPDRASP